MPQREDDARRPECHLVGVRGDVTQPREGVVGLPGVAKAGPAEGDVASPEPVEPDGLGVGRERHLAVDGRAGLPAVGEGEAGADGEAVAAEQALEARVPVVVGHTPPWGRREKVAIGPVRLPVVRNQRGAEGPLGEGAALPAVGSRSGLLGLRGRCRHLRDERGRGHLSRHTPGNKDDGNKVND